MVGEAPERANRAQQGGRFADSKRCAYAWQRAEPWFTAGPRLGAFSGLFAPFGVGTSGTLLNTVSSLGSLALPSEDTSQLTGKREYFAKISVYWV